MVINKILLGGYKMLYVKKANVEDIEKEWAFVRDMPEDEKRTYKCLVWNLA